MIPPRRRLRRRLLLAFAAFAVFTAALFTLFALAFVYEVEDRFFFAQLEDEAARQLRHHAEHGRWTRPRDGHVRLHVGAEMDGLPAGLQERLLAEPWRREFFGEEGRHYHLHRLTDPGGGDAWLVAEVSGHLVVRPLRGRLIAILAAAGVLVLAIAILAGSWIARRIAAPLARLADEVSALQPDHLPRRLAGRHADDEVGVLAAGLETLLQRVRDFVEREQNFTRDASHELRTPLAVIRSAGERLAGASLEPDARAHLDHIRQSAAQLEQTVGTLLALAREQRPAAPAGRATAVLPIVERVIVEQSALLEGKAMRVDVRLGADARLPIPEPVLHIVLANLIGNAFAHTGVGEVVIDQRGGQVRIANRDRTDGERGGSAGFGLGLGIVQRLCERHGIRLRIDIGEHGAVAGIVDASADGEGEEGVGRV